MPIVTRELVFLDTGSLPFPFLSFFFFHFLNKKEEKKIDLRLADTCALLLVASYSPETGNRSRLIHFSRAEKGNENKRSIKESLEKNFGCTDRRGLITSVF